MLNLQKVFTSNNPTSIGFAGTIDIETVVLPSTYYLDISVSSKFFHHRVGTTEVGSEKNMKKTRNFDQRDATLGKYHLSS